MFGRQGSFSSTSKPNMAYAVRISSRAQRDLALLYNWIGADNSVAALRCYRGLKRAILTLEELPTRGSRTPESLRHLLYGAKPHLYRIIYHIVEKQKHVEILHIRHGAWRAFR